MSPKIKLDLSPKDLKVILFSHGWLALAPCVYTKEPLSVRFGYDTPAGQGALKIKVEKDKCFLHVLEGTTATAGKIASRVLSLDIDLTEIYRQTAKDKDFDWFNKRQFGRLFRSPTIYEDCLKTIFSANTVFKRTITMTQKLVETYGAKIGDDYAFPTPQKMIKVSETKLRETSGCGYRAKYLLSLFEKSLEKPDFFLGENWRRYDNEQFAAELRTVKGIGPGAINNISTIYGKPYGFVIDSYIRRRGEDLWGVKPDKLEKYLRQRYSRFGYWAPMIFWFDVVRHWKENRE